MDRSDPAFAYSSPAVYEVAASSNRPGKYAAPPIRRWRAAARSLSLRSMAISNAAFQWLAERLYSPSL